MQANLLNLANVVRSIGRGVVFRADPWSPGTPLVLEHLGDTEGDIVINTNAEMAALTTPELTGPAPHEMDYTGEAPVIEIPLFLASPALLARVSPTGLAGAGRSRRSAPAEHTLVIFPEGLFLETDVNGEPQSVELEHAGSGVWTIDGNAPTAAQQALLDMTFWGWRAVFTRPPQRFLGGAGDARKNIETVTATLMHHPDMPSGHHLYTIGDPNDVGIDIEGGS